MLWPGCIWILPAYTDVCGKLQLAVQAGHAIAPLESDSRLGVPICPAGKEMRGAVDLAVRQCDEDMHAMQGEHAKVNKELKMQLHAVLEQACFLENF